MSGGYVPYHLRPNKAIERQLFIELLSHVDRVQPMPIYTYVGFGGPFLEDFKTIHTQLGIKKMISLEGNEDVYLRQKFNRPHRCIRLTQSSSSDFITDFRLVGPAIFWLDFTSAKDIGEQLRDVEALLSKLQTHDILKVTFNADLNALWRSPGHGRPITREEKAGNRLEKLRERAGIYVDDTIDSSFMTEEAYPKALARMLKLATRNGLQGRPSLIFQPLANFVYSDSTSMLTITGIVLEKATREAFFDQTALRGWEFCETSWTKYKMIDVPMLSVRERLKIDSLLPANSDTAVRRALKYKIVGATDKARRDRTARAIKNYRLYYRHLPYFSRIVV